jgi:hypothetical protein
VTVRLRALAGASLALAVALSAVVIDAARRRDADRRPRADRAQLAAAIGLADLALSSGARWLRHPSQVEPAAAIADAPGALDVDPAGALVSPSRDLLGAGGSGALERRR